MTRLGAVVITFNESAHIADCLASLAFADETLVFDSFSTDETVMLAEQAGARVIQRTFDHFAAQRNAALQAMTGRVEWVLFVDADERVTPELADEIRRAIRNDQMAGYRIPRHNYLFGRLTLGAGWYPDYQTRLLRLGQAQYEANRKVHELVILDGEEGTLVQPLLHHNYRDVAQFHTKQERYTDYEAQILFEQGIRPRPQNYLLQPLRQFRWRFITLHGYRDGWHGLRLSLLMAYYEWRKYWRLRGLWRSADSDHPII